MAIHRILAKQPESYICYQLVFTGLAVREDLRASGCGGEGGVGAAGEDPDRGGARADPSCTSQDCIRRFTLPRKGPLSHPGMAHTKGNGPREQGRHGPSFDNRLPASNESDAGRWNGRPGKEWGRLRLRSHSMETPAAQSRSRTHPARPPEVDMVGDLPPDSHKADRSFLPSHIAVCPAPPSSRPAGNSPKGRSSLAKRSWPPPSWTACSIPAP